MKEARDDLFRFLSDQEFLSPDLPWHDAQEVLNVYAQFARSGLQTEREVRQVYHDALQERERRIKTAVNDVFEKRQQKFKQIFDQLPGGHFLKCWCHLPRNYQKFMG